MAGAITTTKVACEPTISEEIWLIVCVVKLNYNGWFYISLQFTFPGLARDSTKRTLFVSIINTRDFQ